MQGVVTVHFKSHWWIRLDTIYKCDEQMEVHSDNCRQNVIA